MRFLALSVAACLATGGCSTISASREAWDAHAWASATAPAYVTPSALDGARLAELRQQRDAVRGLIAVETDLFARQALYRQLHSVGMQLAPLERIAAGVLRSPG